MALLQKIFPLFCIFLIQGAFATHRQLSDSLRHVLTHTSDPQTRIQLLLNLKDLNEDNELNLPFSIQLFREAAAAGDTYAMSISIVPILTHYGTYPEKQDSLHNHIAQLRRLVPGTPEEGMDAYTETMFTFTRLNAEHDQEKRYTIAKEIVESYAAADSTAENSLQRIGRLILTGQARTVILYREQHSARPYVPQIPMWREAYDLLVDIPAPPLRKLYATLVYYLLSAGYNQAYLFPEQEKLTARHIAVLDAYYVHETALGRRPYLYKDNSYVRPYQQLIRGALNIHRKDYAENYFREFSERMRSAAGEDLWRNKSYLYELGYLFYANVGDNDTSLLYCDSLIRLIEQGKGYFRLLSYKIFQAYRDRAIVLTNAGHFDAACDAFAGTLGVQDSLLWNERRERIETIRQRHDIDKQKLHETRALIRSRNTALFSFIVIGLLLAGAGFYSYRALRRNRQLQADILRHSLKARESEQMKSNFVNTICRGIRPPFNAINQSVYLLMTDSLHSEERQTHIESIRENTTQLLSTLDNMLEAAKLDSLTDTLQFEQTDIDELCRAEVISASRLRHDEAVEYVVEAPGAPCFAVTHAQYFSFVVRALLDNAGKFTRKGRITLRYEKDASANRLTVSVADTGCGIPSEARETIFGTPHNTPQAGCGLSLALCRIIVRHLNGEIRLDTDYTEGARFIFTIPLHP